MDSVCHPQVVFFWCVGLEHSGAQKISPPGLDWLKQCWTGVLGKKWPDCVFKVPTHCSICLSTMHWPEKTPNAAIPFTALSPPTLGREPHEVPPLQNTQPSATHRHCIEPQKNGRMITGKEHGSGPVVVLPFFSLS
ncbi:hypothetical protein TNCV_4867011 [Trichonephila clavipes]|nr:hypothetical protein TNCV_4867011 [Trichonephila clavipes]